MPEAKLLPTKKMRQVYIRPSTHRKLRILAGILAKPMKVVADAELARVLDTQIASALVRGNEVDFKRQPVARNGRGRR